MAPPLKQGYVFDLDGTVYLGDELIPGAGRTIHALRARGSQVAFLSNKPIHSRQEYADKLCRLGIQVDGRDVVNSSWVLAQELARRAPKARVYPIGEPPLVGELKAAGLVVTDDPQQIQFVVAAFDRTFTYEKLNVAFQAIGRGARLIATNADRACPVAGGQIPDAAAVIGALEATTGKRCEWVAGKPSPRMLEVVLGRMGLGPGQCMMVGDRLETDIQMGIAARMTTVLVLTGVTTKQMLQRASIRPDYVLDSIADLVSASPAAVAAGAGAEHARPR